MALMELCQRCSTKIPYKQKYCDDCNPQVKKEKEEYQKVKNQKYNSDRYKRDRESQDRIRMFYLMGGWHRKREQIKRRDNNECQICKALFKFNPIDDVHHIVPLTKDFAKRLDNDNLIGLCKKHHQEIHYYNINNKEQLEKFIKQKINSDKFIKNLLNMK